jgi:hypothetical protein
LLPDVALVEIDVSFDDGLIVAGINAFLDGLLGHGWIP